MPFSNVRHRARAAFLLCDELVEMTCKTRMRQTHPTIGKSRPINFCLTDVNLGEMLFRNHETRNVMQHAAAAATVDEQHCADAIMDAILCIDHCFSGSSAMLPDPIVTALRVVRMLSSQGNPRHRDAFDNAMRAYKWNSPFTAAKGTELPVPVGNRLYWGHVLMPNSTIIAGILNNIGAP